MLALPAAITLAGTVSLAALACARRSFNTVALVAAEIFLVKSANKLCCVALGVIVTAVDTGATGALTVAVGLACLAIIGLLLCE
jgi:hypothetical protein